MDSLAHSPQEAAHIHREAETAVVDVEQLREGDVVLVRGVVGRPDQPRHSDRNIGIVFNHAGSGRTTHYVQASAIVSVETRAVRPGDRVKMANREDGEVLFVGAERAFVRWSLSDPKWGAHEETATLLTHLELKAEVA